jgi:Cd2+/Zn2+-exporting ATPase
MASVQSVELTLDGIDDCGACATRLEGVLRTHEGVAAVQVSSEGRSLLVRYDPELCSPSCMRQATVLATVQSELDFQHDVLEVGGMDCASCARTIERAVDRMQGVTFASVSFSSARLRVEYRPDVVDTPRIASGVRALGYDVPGAGAPARAAGRWPRAQIVPVVAAALMTLAIAADLAFGRGLVAILLYAAALAVGGTPVARAGLAALRATHRADIRLLMAIAAIGAAAISAWTEAALVVVLFSIGEMLERRAAERARRELGSLVALSPTTARRRAPGASTDAEVAVADLRPGDDVVVRPGERLPVDGTVLEGASAVDEAAVTGESTPVDKLPGDAVFAGTLNTQGLLVVRTGAAPGDTTLAKIARLVTEAQARKAPSERWVDAFARIYTPIVIVAAALVAALAPLALSIPFGDAFYAALAMLIIACPCALVLSTPVSIVSALGRASAAGVLVKGGAHLERAAGIQTVAFDKTGTLTSGRPRVTALRAFSGTEDELLRYAAGVEQGSEHPLARAIVATAADRGLALPALRDFHATTGLGARGSVAGHAVAVGSPRLLAIGELPAAARAILEELSSGGATTVLVTRDGEPIGALALADEPRPEAAEAVAMLQRLGIGRTALLTGDQRVVGEAIARRVGISEVQSELLPQDKATAIERFGGATAMVGDGVNDAPALAAADVGIAMGTAGSDTAIEVADVALMGDDPRKVAELIGLARWTRSVVRQNIAFALVTKLVALGLLAAGSLPLWAAVVSDVGASLVVVANGLRLIGGMPGGRMRGLPVLGVAQRGSAAPPHAHDHDDDHAPRDEHRHDCCPHDAWSSKVGHRSATPDR